MKKIIDYIEKTQLIIGATLLSVFLITVMIQIITRYLSISVLWTEEVATFSFIWAVFMGASVMVRRDQHFSFTYIKDKASGIKKYILNLIIYTVMLVFILFTLIYSFQLTGTFWNYNWISLPDLKMGYVWLCLPLMAISMAIYTLEHMVNNIKLIIACKKKIKLAERSI